MDETITSVKKQMLSGNDKVGTGSSVLICSINVFTVRNVVGKLRIGTVY